MVLLFKIIWLNLTSANQPGDLARYSVNIMSCADN